MLNNLDLGLLALVRSAIDGKAAKCPEGLSLAQLLPAIKRQQLQLLALAGMDVLGDAIKRENFSDLLQIGAQSVSLLENQRLEADRLFADFEEAKIDYMPLKGILVQKLYPKENMRAMSDVDILVRREQYERIVPIMERAGFVQGEESDHEYHWMKDKVHIELHKSLMPSYHKSLYAYFGDGWEKAAPVHRGACRYEMNDEDQFIYIFAHYAKHFRDGGIGTQHFTDLWVYRRAKPDMDEEKIIAGIKALNFYEFYQNVMQAARAWFQDEPLTEKAEQITRETLSGGAYGKAKSRQNAEVVRNFPKGGKSAKLKWLLRKIFPSYRNMCGKYPWLRRLPFLWPVSWVIRWIVALCRPKKMLKRVKMAQSLTGSSVEGYRMYLDYLGLQYDDSEE